jgi:hypothetical protein
MTFTISHFKLSPISTARKGLSQGTFLACSLALGACSSSQPSEPEAPVVDLEEPYVSAEVRDVDLKTPQQRELEPVDEPISVRLSQDGFKDELEPAPRMEERKAVAQVMPKKLNVPKTEAQTSKSTHAQPPVSIRNTRDIQYLLKELGYYRGQLDGKYGPRSRDAVMKFQGNAGLKMDGVVGDQTKQALMNAVVEMYNREFEAD